MAPTLCVVADPATLCVANGAPGGPQTVAGRRASRAACPRGAWERSIGQVLCATAGSHAPRGSRSRDALRRQRCAWRPAGRGRSQGVQGCMPTRSVGTIRVGQVLCVTAGSHAPRGSRSRDALRRQQVAWRPAFRGWTQSVQGCMPTRSVGTIRVGQVLCVTAGSHAPRGSRSRDALRRQR